MGSKCFDESGSPVAAGVTRIPRDAVDGPNGVAAPADDEDPEDESGDSADDEEYRDDRACAGPSTSPRRAGRGRHRRRGHRWGAHRLTGGSSGSDISAISPSTNPVGFASLSSTSRATSAAADV